ncbi:MAG: tetratricopeptide repeat protein [Alphaproteobacteria bacterium]|nr:MAG: tetratricopeptide repeat protein [Alphaproteobacteria bacterium]
MSAQTSEPMGDAQPLRLSVSDTAGDAASSTSLGQIKKGLTGSAAKKSIKLMRGSVAALAQRDYRRGAELALEALKLDEKLGLAWHLLAISREKSGQTTQAILAYEAAVKLLPDESAVAADLGRLAQRMGQLEIAEKLYLKHLATHPGHIEVTNNLATSQRDQGRYGDAIETLRSMIAFAPQEPMLWNTLGTVLSDKGDMGGSVVFFDEALRLDPAFTKALYNRANVRMALGDVHQSLADIAMALSQIEDPQERDTIRMAKAMTEMFAGNLVTGFEDYEARFSTHLPEAVSFVTKCPLLTLEDDLLGRHVLVMGEQGLGDEVLFANVLPDLLAAIGPDGHMTLAVEHRLIPLMRRSFPGSTIVAHRTARIDGRLTRMADGQNDDRVPDYWTPIGSLFRHFRTTQAAFPSTRNYLQPDPARVAYWKQELDNASSAPKVGVVWKSLRLEGMRLRYFAPFDLWRPVLSNPDVMFVNLQYGDVSEEIEAAKAQGISFWTPPGINLKDDLDDLAALTCAMDLVIGPPNATSNIAAACGVPWWAFSTPDDWQRFGTDRFPCYPSVRIFPIDGFGEWEGAMARVGDALTAWSTSGIAGNAR